MLIDSHCHLHMIDYAKLGMSMDQTVQTALDADVRKMLCVATHLDQMQELYQIANKYSQVYISVGLHPNDQIETEPEVADYINAAQQHKSVVAIGETGLDYYRGSEHAVLQQERFRRQIAAAKQLSLPIIVHTRQAKEDTIEVLKSADSSGITGVMHCFTEDLDMARKSLDLGFYISISGIITFANAADLREVVKFIPLDRLLIETDAPWLAPQPVRGKINHPENVKYVAEFIAKLKQVSLHELAEQTTKNCQQLFKWQ